MDKLTSLVMMIIFISGILLLISLRPRTGFATTGMKIRKAISTPLNLAEFLGRKPDRGKHDQYYFFSEENVRSLGHRFIGRFDGAIFHWENVPVLDLIIEYKFPVKHLPQQSRPEDVFQAGLYALALLESGVSCTSTKLVTIYCLQENAKKCIDQKESRECWKCNKSQTHVTRFKPKTILRELNRLDEVWYNGRKPRPAQDSSSCRVCPYNESCNYSLI